MWTGVEEYGTEKLYYIGRMLQEADDSALQAEIL